MKITILHDVEGARVAKGCVVIVDVFRAEAENGKLVLQKY
jgi:hypothetical protein